MDPGCIDWRPPPVGGQPSPQQPHRMTERAREDRAVQPHVVHLIHHPEHKGKRKASPTFILEAGPVYKQTCTSPRTRPAALPLLPEHAAQLQPGEEAQGGVAAPVEEQQGHVPTVAEGFPGAGGNRHSQAFAQEDQAPWPSSGRRSVRGWPSFRTYWSSPAHLPWSLKWPRSAWERRVSVSSPRSYPNIRSHAGLV
ncbi:hypothetical protein D187_001175 [Cystobacter fuscus DSM 2262]|uniref:Uncharacterized protein n=1 Tax=Cystobacter fuscus (strain ATCC 25194 / DSM 2262 / NBRC 100088 / M29) TaxID=1242864 RepID=S9PG62_CYSF2|nr:hypothetical protein D187_001175 [Cystobacter fuscus DSM 2262]